MGFFDFFKSKDNKQEEKEDKKFLNPVRELPAEYEDSDSIIREANRKRQHERDKHD